MGGCYLNFLPVGGSRYFTFFSWKLTFDDAFLVIFLWGAVISSFYRWGGAATSSSSLGGIPLTMPLLFGGCYLSFFTLGFVTSSFFQWREPLLHLLLWRMTFNDAPSVGELWPKLPFSLVVGVCYLKFLQFGGWPLTMPLWFGGCYLKFLWWRELLPSFSLSFEAVASLHLAVGCYHASPVYLLCYLRCPVGSFRPDLYWAQFLGSKIGKLHWVVIKHHKVTFSPQNVHGKR